MTNPRLLLLLALFSGMLIGMNLLGGKITTLFGVSVSVAIFMIPFTFLITDIVEEVYGKEVVKQFIISGVTALVVIFMCTSLFVWLAPNERFADNASYVTIFGMSLRMMIASIIAFVLAQLHDMWAFAKIKEKTHGKMLWLRNNVSTILSQLIDASVFMFIAFYMITPQFDALFIIQLIIPYYIFRVVFALLDTPFVYLGVKWLRKGEKSKL